MMQSTITGIWHKLVFIWFSIYTSSFTLKFALIPCSAYPLSYHEQTYILHSGKNYLFNLQDLQSCRIPQRFNWKINWGITSDHWSWKPCLFLGASTAAWLNRKDTTTKVWGQQILISDSSATTTKWKTFMLHSQLRGGKRSKAYWQHIFYSILYVLPSLILPTYKLGASSLLTVLFRIKFLQSQNLLMFTQIHY